LAERRSEGDAEFGELAARTIDALGERTDSDTPLILATTKGEIGQQIRWMRAADEGVGGVELPTLGWALQRLTRGRRMRAEHVVSTACTSGLVALIEAAMEIAEGSASSVMAIGADVAQDFVRDGFNALKAQSPTVCRPFDRDRHGLTLGSAAAGCLLKAERDAETLAVLSGFGISNDATHMTAPDRKAGGLIRAIRQALRHAGLEPSEIDVVFAHGTGTPYNDAMEAVAIEKVFLDAGASPAVTAVKGLIGHTLGAAGMIEAALAVEMLRRQVIVPVAHLEVPENTRMDFVTRPRGTKIRHVLKIASGFGGMNAAVIMSAPEERTGSRKPAGGEWRGANVVAAAGASNSEFRCFPGKATGNSEFRSPDPLASLALGALQPLVGRIPAEKRAATGLVLGTTLGCLETDRAFDRSRREHNGRYASPTAFSRTLPSTVAAELSLRFQLTGPSLVLSAGDSSAAIAVRRGVAWMRHFDLDYCIAGGIDWIGPTVGTHEEKKVAFVLLGRETRGTVAAVNMIAEAQANLAALRDHSLDALFEWIGKPEAATIGGIAFTPQPHSIA